MINTHKAWLGLPVAFAALLSGPRMAAAPAALGAPFRVTVTPLARSARVGDGVIRFPVLLRVINASPVPQSFRAFNCSWQQSWAVQTLTRPRDITSLIEGGPCFANFMVTSRLRPGEVYEKRSEITTLGTPGRRRPKVFDALRLHRISFRVGFDRLGFTPYGDKTHVIYWSDAAAVAVVN